MHFSFFVVSVMGNPEEESTFDPEILEDLNTAVQDNETKIFKINNPNRSQISLSYSEIMTNKLLALSRKYLFVTK